MEPLASVLQPAFTRRGVELVSVRTQTRTRLAVVYKVANGEHRSLVVQIDNAQPQSAGEETLARLALEELDRRLRTGA